MIERIAVIGAGIMGRGIALHFAVHGYSVTLFDAYPQARNSAPGLMAADLALLEEEGVVAAGSSAEILGRIQVLGSMAAAAADAQYVIEAAPENVALKREIFNDLSKVCKPDAIFASNTSSLALNDMAEGLPECTKKRMMVCHWYNPAHIMPIVELSFFGNMEQEPYNQVEQLYISSGKVPVKVLKDVPGLVANRIQQGVAREVFWLIENGVANPEDIDKALKFGPGFRYATTGQLEVADFGGLDIWCTVGNNLLAVMDNRQQANPLLQEKVQQGKLGFKSGEGFFAYPEQEKPELLKAFNKRLIHQLKASEYYK